MKVYVNVEQFDDEFKDHTMKLVAETLRYKTMWVLRRLEEQINAENGHIIIHVKHGESPMLELNGFSDLLKQFISVEVKKVIEPPIF